MKHPKSCSIVACLLLASASTIASAQIIGGDDGNVTFLSEGLLTKGKSYIKLTGEIAFTHNWDGAGSFKEGLAPVAKKTEFEGKKGTGAPMYWAYGKWGFIDKKGTLIIPPTWDYCRHFSEGLAVVGQNTIRDGKTADPRGVPYTSQGFINTTGKLVIPLQWDKCHSFHEGLAGVERGGKLGFIDKTGKVVVPVEWEMKGHVEPRFSEGLAAVKRNGKWGYIDKKGTIVIPITWDDCEDFSEGLAPVVRPGGPPNQRKWGFIDRTGKVAIAEQWWECRSFSEGLAVVSDGSKFSYIDITGKLIAPLQWESAQPFRDGLGAVMKNKKWGYIDRAGTLVIPHQWELGQGDVRFSNGFAFVDSKVIDKKGNVVSAPFQK